jgi:hypothetical protein
MSDYGWDIEKGGGLRIEWEECKEEGLIVRVATVMEIVFGHGVFC